MTNIALIVLVTLSICACGELSYKRGAPVGQYENTRKACQEKSPIRDIQQCMQENGWSVQQLDSLEIMTDFNTEPAQKKMDPSTTLDKEAAIQSNQKNSEFVTQSTSIKKAVTSNPLDKFVVPSWWKTGVNSDSFRVDSEACVEKLGVDHQPEYKTQTVTYAFISCMIEKGWVAFKKN